MLDLFTIASIVTNYKKNKALTYFGLHHQLLSVHFLSSRDGRLWHNYTAQQNAVKKKIQVLIFPCSTSSGAVKKRYYSIRLIIAGKTLSEFTYVKLFNSRVWFSKLYFLRNRDILGWSSAVDLSKHLYSQASFFFSFVCLNTLVLVIYFNCDPRAFLQT